jgi:hypothetical protein
MNIISFCSFFSHFPVCIKLGLGWITFDCKQKRLLMTHIGQEAGLSTLKPLIPNK